MWDSEYYSEYSSEIDAIVDEAVEKIKETIADKVNSSVNEYKDKYIIECSHNQKLREELSNSQRRIDALEEDKSKLTDKLSKEDISKMIPYNIGDEVFYVIQNNFGAKEVTCPECGGTRVLKRLIEGTEYTANCSKCAYSVPSVERNSSSETYYTYKAVKAKIIEINAVINESGIHYSVVIKTVEGKLVSNVLAELLYQYKEDAEDCATRLYRKSHATALYKTGNPIPDILAPYLPKNIKKV